MKNQINYKNEGAQAQVNNLAYAMQMAELEAQMEQEVVNEQLLLTDLECQAKQDAALEQMMLLEFECQRPPLQTRCLWRISLIRMQWYCRSDIGLLTCRHPSLMPPGGGCC